MEIQTKGNREYEFINLCIDINWEKDGITHRDSYFAENMNCWRDIFPGSVLEAIAPSDPGQTVVRTIPPGQLLPDHSPDKVITLPRSQFNPPASIGPPAPGKFYPQGIISGLTGVFKENLIPFRCVDIEQERTDQEIADQDRITVDLNHPMAGIPMEIAMTVQTRSPASHERGGSCTDWIDLALTGPGMQARYDGNPTHFNCLPPLPRRDAGPDPLFYEIDRFVHHIDETASENLSKIYTELIKPGDAVLDLMAGWESHIPEDLDVSTVHGIGLNANELKHNPRLKGHTVQDLNADPILSFEDHTFDTVICSLSVEYLTDPVAVFNQAARVLKPGGTFAVAFSNRWFPEKAITIWADLHEFERMGLVLEYFFESNRYDNLSTISKRGYPRPDQDAYSSTLHLSDPIYAVIGKSKR